MHPHHFIARAVLAGALAMAAQAAAWAQPAATGPVGLWKTIDDSTRQEKSLVRVSEAAGVLTAKVEKLLDPTKQDAVCTDCSDARKGQPVLGMTVISGVRQSSSDAGLWDGGEILDPNNGKTYKVRLKPVDGGKKLEVRGYIGAPILGRTQTWLRVE